MLCIVTSAVNIRHRNLIDKLHYVQQRLHYTYISRRNQYHCGVRMGATTVGTGGDQSPILRLGTNNVLVLHLIGSSFKKQEISCHREPSNKHSGHQNAGFSI